MIARPLPYEDRPARVATGTRAGRFAVDRRRSRTRRARYAALVRIFAGITALVLVVVVYLALMANVTRMSYELAKLAKQRATLIDVTSTNDEAIANASSSERLRAIAHRLQMHEPLTFAAVALPRDRPARAPSGGIAFLGWLK